MSKGDKILLLGIAYTREMMFTLSKGPKRFRQLSKACPNERTRSRRLKELIEAGWVTTVSLKIGKRHFVHYALTNVGEAVVEELCRLKKVL